MTIPPNTSSEAVERSNGFTPGPWNISADHPYVDSDGSDGPVCKINLHNRNADANTHLIAAAPESHEANKLFMAALEDEYHFYPKVGDDWIQDTVGTALSTAYFAARAAIAKALAQ